MRFMCMVKMDETPREVPPSLYEAMAAYDRRAGRPACSSSARGCCRARPARSSRPSTGRVKAVDGPFAEAKELVGGYAVIDVRSREEAVELGRRLVQLHLDHCPDWDGTVEIRQIADF